MSFQRDRSDFGTAGGWTRMDTDFLVLYQPNVCLQKAARTE
jgi:hypothetical protein